MLNIVGLDLNFHDPRVELFPYLFVLSVVIRISNILDNQGKEVNKNQN